VNRGTIHDYLGITLDFTDPGKVKIKMDEYVKSIIVECTREMPGHAATPSSAHLFTVSTETDSNLLPAAQAKQFHHVVAQLLFLCKRAKPNIQTAVAFLCTCVKAPDNDDYKKLSRVIRYLRYTRELYLTLETSSINVLKWYVDASFASHADMRSHTGSYFTLGKGGAYCSSTRQKLNTKRN
jgi:hypothetical protein